MSSLGIGSKQALQILKKGFDNTSGIVLQAVPPKKVTIEQILDPIEKDLEVLEILKRWLIIYDWENGGFIEGRIDYDANKQEYNKIKEYIENGKKQLWSKRELERKR